MSKKDKRPAWNGQLYKYSKLVQDGQQDTPEAIKLRKKLDTDPLNHKELKFIDDFASLSKTLKEHWHKVE